MYDQLYKEISEEILNLRKEIVTWQSEALKGQEVRALDWIRTIMLMSL